MGLFLKKLALVLLSNFPLLSKALPGAVSDPCANIAGQTFALPADVLACYKFFPFNETIRQNVLTNAARVLDFYTFEDYYLNSPPPFQESTNNIRGTLDKLNTTKFDTDYDFHKALYDFTTQLNDGHTRYFPNCYDNWQSLLPAPIVSLEVNGVQNIYVVPDLVEFIPLVGEEYTDYFDSINFDWKRLAGAKVLEIEDMDAYAYVDHIASTVSGNYLDHGVRVNSGFSSYRISAGAFSQRFGDVAGPSTVNQNSLKMKLITVNSTKAETVTIPYLASFAGIGFSDAASFWENNCLANILTNGFDFSISGNSARKTIKPRLKANIVDLSQLKAVGLPDPYIPTAPQGDSSDDALKFFVLPGNKTGVMFVGTFEPIDFDQFQADVDAGLKELSNAGVTQLLIDLTNNGGGYVCLGQFLHSYLSGSSLGYPGFVSSQRANPLAKKIVSHWATQGGADFESYYTADNWAFLNGTFMPNTYDYDSPPDRTIVNGKVDLNSQRFQDTCELSYSQTIPTNPPFDLKKVAIVTNGNCASTCAMFSTLMFERHQTKIAVFGGKPGEMMQFKGMAGNQVLEWSDLDTEIKSAGFSDDPLAPPDLIVDSNFRVNWRTAWSWSDLNQPIAYRSELPQFRFAYTKDTYNNPQNLWSFASSKMF